jgi:hypothetical protein
MPLHSPFSVPHFTSSLKSKIHHTPPPPITSPPPPFPPPAPLRPFHPPPAAHLSFSPFFPRKPISPNFFNCFHFFSSILGTNPFLDCDPLICWLFGFVFAGGWFDFKGDFKPLSFWAPTSCSTKFPNQHSSCLEAKAPLLGPLGPKAWSPGFPLRAVSSYRRTPLPLKRSSPIMRQ